LIAIISTTIVTTIKNAAFYIC